MPLADFRCINQHTTEKFTKKPMDIITCPECGELASKLPPLIALTQSSWGDCTGQFGVNGVYDPNLRCYVKNERHRDQLLKERGLIRAIDAKDTMASNARARKEKEARQDEVFAEYDKLVASGLSEGDAQVAALPAEKILAGDFDDTF